ncbi:unnamed protein product [Polarella glacialis]|uniref:Uncharacterized protein n=1 Tax=Polarella glacialis TaxID=89957 RepID=A0A813F3V4_POLGL|nr:unnamed protein product [Polarella glacialis]
MPAAIDWSGHSACVQLSVVSVAFWGLSIWAAVDANSKWQHEATVRNFERAPFKEQLCDVTSSPKLKPIACKTGKGKSCFFVEVPVYISSSDVFAMAKRYRSADLSFQGDEAAARKYASQFTDSGKVACYQFVDDQDDVKLDAGVPEISSEASWINALVAASVLLGGCSCMSCAAGAMLRHQRSQSSVQPSEVKPPEETRLLEPEENRLLEEPEEELATEGL